MDQSLSGSAGSGSAGPEAGEQWQSIKFHADGQSYFAIWIVNLVLTLLTLGIYSAWATVRERRYLYGSVEVADSRFDFHGKPLQILVGRLMALVLLIAWTQGHYIHYSVQFIALAVILVLFPWFLVRAMSFRLRNTSLRNLRFDFQADTRAAYALFGKYLLIVGLAVAAMVWSVYSAFGGLEASAVSQQPDMFAVGRFVLVYLVLILGFCFLYPAFICDIRRFSVNHTHYGHHPFSVTLYKADFIGYFWAAIGLAVGASLAVGIVMAIVVGIASFAQVEAGRGFGGVIVTIFIGYLLMGLCYLLGYAYWQVRTFNKIFSSLALKDITFRSHIQVWPLCKILLGNTLLMLVTLGFAYPWTRVRLMRYKLCAIEYLGDAEQFTGSQVTDLSAVGDEVGESFDLDFGFGL